MTRSSFNDGWTVGPNVSVFSEITGGATSVSHVTLPHDALLDLPRSADADSGGSSGYFPGGAVVYRKTFLAPDKWRSRVIELEFHGVYRDAMVYLNGILIGQRPNGYTPFRVRLDDALAYGEMNRLRVDARAHRDSRWYSGLGIHRDVDLLDMPLAHVEPSATRITTPDIDDRRAVVEVRTPVTNDGRSPVTPTLLTRVLDSGGREVARESSPVTVRPGRTAMATQRLYVERPVLWSPGHPALYRVTVELVDAGEATDSAEHVLGIRRLQLDPENGLRINGEAVKLRGACIHHDNGILGAISVAGAEYRRVHSLKSAGFNAIRSAHNPASPALLDACDRLGMLVIDEAFDMWTEGKQPFDYSLAFPEWWERDLEAMVERDYNHPSVVIYSIGNEILDAGKPLGASIGRELAEKVRALDPTRFLTNGISGFVATLSDTIPQIQDELAGVPGGINDVEGVGQAIIERVSRSQFVTDATAESHAVVDIVGHNYAAWRYALEREQFPNRVVVGTETNPKDIAENWALVTEFPHVIGDFTWTGWDYLGEAGLGRTTYAAPGEGWHGDAYPALLAYCGDIDITGFRRPASYYREIVFGLRTQPYVAVHHAVPAGLAPSGLGWAWSDSLASWTWDYPYGTPLAVDVYSDADEVELLLDGRSMGTAAAGRANRFQATFEVPYAPGVLSAIAYRAGKRAETTELRSAGPLTHLKATLESPVLVAAGDHSFISIELTDSAGELVPIDDRIVSVVVTGDAELVGLGTARPATQESFSATSCTTFEGRAQAVVRFTGNGAATVTVEVDGLAPVEIALTPPSGMTARDQPPTCE
ncbi:MAG: glycoside hydrolase family 2 TIM barrel-domain containing protein [Microbacterium sp.]